MIQKRFPVTLSLAVGAAIIWVIMGVTIGVISALKRGSLFDRFAMTLALAGVSLPIFWTGLVSLAFFSYHLGWTPPGASYTPLTENPLKWAHALLLPWITLALLFSAQYARLTRAGMLETMGEDYIRTARAKGLPERTVVVKHGLRSALTPIVTIFGLDFGLLIGGAVLTETVFGLPGLGQLAIKSTKNNDLPPVLAVVLITASLRGAVQPGRRPAVRRHRPESAYPMTADDLRAAAPHVARGRRVPRRARPEGALPHRRRRREVGRRALLPARARQDARHRRGVRVRQVRDQHDHHGPAREERPDRRLDPARRPGAGRRVAGDRPSPARQADGDDLPGPAVLDAPLLHGRQPDHRGLPDPQRRLQEGGPRAHAIEMLDRVGIPEPCAARRRLPAPVLRRHAPARDDRDGAAPATPTC